MADPSAPILITQGQYVGNYLDPDSGQILSPMQAGITDPGANPIGALANGVQAAGTAIDQGIQNTGTMLGNAGTAIGQGLQNAGSFVGSALAQPVSVGGTGIPGIPTLGEATQGLLPAAPLGAMGTPTPADELNRFMAKEKGGQTSAAPAPAMPMASAPIGAMGQSGLSASPGVGPLTPGVGQTGLGSIAAPAPVSPAITGSGPIAPTVAPSPAMVSGHGGAARAPNGAAIVNTPDTQNVGQVIQTQSPDLLSMGSQMAFAKGRENAAAAAQPLQENVPVTPELNMDGPLPAAAPSGNSLLQNIGNAANSVFGYGTIKAPTAAAAGGGLATAGALNGQAQIPTAPIPASGTSAPIGALGSSPDLLPQVQQKIAQDAEAQQGPGGALNAQPHGTSTLQNIATALGLRPAGPSYTGSGMLDDIQDDPNRMALLQAGLGTMAAAGQPGATLGGALGQGGLSMLAAQREQKQLDFQNKMLQANQNFERTKFGLDYEQKGKELNIAQQNANDHATEATAAMNRSAAMLTTAATGQTRAAQQSANDNVQQDLDRQRLNIQSTEATYQAKNVDSDVQKRYDDSFDADVKTSMAGTANTIFDPAQLAQVKNKADAAAAVRFPQSSQAKTVAAGQLQQLQTALMQYTQAGDKGGVQRTTQAIQGLISEFFPHSSTSGQ